MATKILFYNLNCTGYVVCVRYKTTGILTIFSWCQSNGNKDSILQSELHRLCCMYAIQNNLLVWVHIAWKWCMLHFSKPLHWANRSWIQAAHITDQWMWRHDKESHFNWHGNCHFITCKIKHMTFSIIRYMFYMWSIQRRGMLLLEWNLDECQFVGIWSHVINPTVGHWSEIWMNANSCEACAMTSLDHPSWVHCMDF